MWMKKTTFAASKAVFMRHCNKNIAFLLLSVYLPMLLLSSFHIHTEQERHCGVANEQQTNSQLDGSDCLLCQFLQQAYEETPQVALQVILPVVALQEMTPDFKAIPAFEDYQPSRAPPFCL